MKFIFYCMFISHLLSVPVALAEHNKIWAVADQKFISEKTLITKLERSKNILLGIRPDNPDHHKRAAKIIENLVKQGQEPVILLGNVERSKQNAFAIFNQRHRDTGKNYDATGIDMLLDWSHSGQPDWAIVRPVFDLAMLKKLPLKAINFSRYEIGELHRNGLGGLPDDVKPDLLPLLKTTPQIGQESPAAYCDILPPEVLAKFVTIRHARNGLFALAMAGIKGKTAVLITPHAPVRKDTGVPHYLSKLEGSNKSISLSFVETGKDMTGGQVDFIWYTEKISRPLPCLHHLTN